MNKRFLWLAAVVLVLVLTRTGRAMAETATEVARGEQHLTIAMAELPALPANLEGAFVGSVGDALVVGGGIRPLTEPRLPVADDFVGQIWLLSLDTREATSPDNRGSIQAGRWRSSSVQLPRAFGAVATLGTDLYCVGGLDANGLSGAVSRFSATGQGANLELKEQPLPALPVPTAFAGATIKNHRLHVIGGITALTPVQAGARHWVLDLKDPTARWQERPAAASLANIVAPVVGVRRDDIAEADALYLAGGWSYAAETGLFEPLPQAWKYLDKSATANWVELSAPPAAVVFRAGLPLGPAHWLLFGLQQAGTRASVAELCASPAGQTAFYTYHTFTDRWVELPWRQELRGVALAGRGKGFALVATQAPGENAAAAWWGAFQYDARHFNWPDYTVLGGYMLALLLIGFWCSRKEHDTAEFFLGSRNIPWWAAGLSMYATGISAISFMAIPAKTYATNWVRFTEPMMGFVAMLVAGCLFVPVLRRLNLTTMMEYLELRFSKTIRFLSSFLAVAGQIAGRMGVVLLLPSIALEAVTGLPVVYCVLIMGVIATLYTVLGGIRAVIWTDVLQFFVFFGGALLCFGLIAAKVGGLGELVATGRQFGKLHTFDFSWSFTSVTVWVMILWGIGDVMGRLGQDNMQRAFATKGAGQARKAMITCAVASVPGALLFFVVGTGLFVFYRLHPQLLNPTLDNDTILPLFVAQQLPAGISGLIIAGLFAAAMSTLDSAMNGVSTIITRDWYSVFHVNTPERTRLWTARVITVVCGVLGTLMALYMASLGVRSLWDTFAKLMGLIGGAFAGITALALLTKRANWLGALLGAAVNLGLLFLIKDKVHFLIYGITFMATGFVAGYLFSILLDTLLPEPVRTRLGLIKDLTGLTVWTPSAAALDQGTQRRDRVGQPV